MDEAKLNLLIKKSIVPRASLSSLIMCVSSVGKTDINAACLYIKALCDQDISKAASVTKHLSGKLEEACSGVVYDVLCQRIANRSALSEEDLLAILEFDDSGLLQTAIPSVSNLLVGKVFARCTSQQACRLMTMILQCTSDNLIDASLQEFTVFINRYESSGDLALSQLLPVLLEHNAVVTLSKLLEILGIAKISSLYGNGLHEELDRMIISGFDSRELWDAYFHFLFQSQCSMEDLLVRGLWHIQLYASDENERNAIACFYLYSAEHLGVDHPIFDLTDGFERASYFSRKHTARYQEAFQRFWDSPALLARFLEKTAICNPFNGDVLQDNNFTMRRDIHNFQDYAQLVALFEKKASCETILKLFFCTDLKNKLPLEDLLYLSKRHDVLKQMLEHLGKIEFDGVAKKHIIGEVVLAPKSYCVVSLHVMPLDYHILEDRKSAVRNWKGKTLSYTITDFDNGKIIIRGFSQEAKSPNLPDDRETWKEAIASLEQNLATGDEEKLLSYKGYAVYNFSVDSFVEENDFGLLTDIYLRYPDRIDSLRFLLSHAKWNAAFIAADAAFPSRFYSDFGQYQDQAIQMFQAMFATPANAYTKILNLYFSSIYRVIVPFDRLLEIADRELMLKVLSSRVIYMRLLQKGQPLCRPLYVACAPVCRVENTEELSSLQKFPAIVTDYTVVGGVVSRIVLRGQHIQPLDVKERGSLFGYLALNEHISRQKSALITRIPDIDTYSSRELLFNLNCMEKAILLRKSSRETLLQLIHLLDTKNPFIFQHGIQVDISYLGKLYSENRRKKMNDALVSMILNASDICAVSEIYCNTCVKYYTRIDELAQLLANRRADLADNLPQMFENVHFQCTADSNGWLWSPYVPQSSVMVGSQYAGLELVCSLHIGIDGIISAYVISATQSSTALYPMALCLLTGYQMSDAIEPYLSDCLIEQNIIKDDNGKMQAVLRDSAALRALIIRSLGGQKLSHLADEEKTEFTQQLQQLHQLLYDDVLAKKELVKQTCSLIQTWGRDIPMPQMEKELAELSKKLMQSCADKKVIIRFLKKVFSSYSYAYRDNGLARIFLSQLTEYLGNEVAAQFDAEIQKSSKFHRNK